MRLIRRLKRINNRAIIIKKIAAVQSCDFSFIILKGILRIRLVFLEGNCLFSSRV